VGQIWEITHTELHCHNTNAVLFNLLPMDDSINAHCIQDVKSSFFQLSHESEESHVEAARKVKALHNEQATVEELDSSTIEIQASFDGTYKNRGLSSKHCIVTAISTETGDVLDTEYITNLCT